MIKYNFYFLTSICNTFDLAFDFLDTNYDLLCMILWF